MYRTYIETCGAGLMYESDVDLNDYFEKYGKYLEFPGLKTFDITPNEYPFVVRYFNNSKKNVICSNNCIEINYPMEELTPASIIFMGYILMEKQRADKSMATIHTACVSKDNNGILLFGRTGSGKTTLALNLCREYEYSLIGNDRNIVGLNKNGVVAYDGTKFIFLRYESIKRNLPDLLHFFPSEDIDSWLNKTKILPNDIGIAVNSEKSIKKSYILHIDNNQRELFVKNGDTPANRLYLNELFSMYIRGIYTTFSDKDFHAVGYIPSYDNEDLYKKRIELVNSIFSQTELEYISGNISDVSRYIDEKQKKLVYNKERERFKNV